MRPQCKANRRPSLGLTRSEPLAVRRQRLSTREASQPESHDHIQRVPTLGASVAFSIIIPVHSNDWKPLQECLESLAKQQNAPSFEVIVVGGGGQVLARILDNWPAAVPLRLVEFATPNIAGARNRGVATARGSVLLFVDADCRLAQDCLSSLFSAVIDTPQRGYFQLRLVGDSSRLVGRAEQLRLTTIQDYLMQPSGCIRYLNTAGFAIRRDKVPADGALFDDRTRRGEDTLLLTQLIRNGELPKFVADAVVQHAIPLPVTQCLLKDIRSGYLIGQANRRIVLTGVSVRMTHRERLRILKVMWKASHRPGIGRAGFALLVTRQFLERVTSSLCGYLSIPALLRAGRTLKPNLTRR